MPLPMPTIEIGSSTSSVNQGETFAWVTTATGPNPISVNAQNMPNGSPWFTPACSFNGPASGPLNDNSNVVTAASQSSPVGGWSYTSSLPGGNGHVVVHMRRDEEKKAS
jgi:hypothetical protein